MMNIILPLLAAVCIAAAVFIALSAVMSCGDGDEIEIFIDADKAGERLEEVVLGTLLVAEKYFKNSAVYIKGGEEKKTDALCRTYGVLKK